MFEIVIISSSLLFNQFILPIPSDFFIFSHSSHLKYLVGISSLYPSFFFSYSIFSFHSLITHNLFLDIPLWTLCKLLFIFVIFSITGDNEKGTLFSFSSFLLFLPDKRRIFGFWLVLTAQRSNLQKRKKNCTPVLLLCSRSQIILRKPLKKTDFSGSTALIPMLIYTKPWFVTELCHAATKIQATFRGHAVRKQTEANKKEEDELSKELEKLDPKVSAEGILIPMY